MLLKRCILPIAGWILLGGSAIAYSQVGPAARSSNLPLVVGAGISDFNADWANARIDGSGLWIDYYPGIITRHVHGLGLEVEGHDLSWNRPPTVPSNYRQDTAGGGAIYSWHHFQNFRPYAKGLIEFGSFDFTFTGSPNYHHDTRSLYAIGGGLDYHVFRHIWVRADYEEQIWQPMFGHTSHGTPNGFTFGAEYDFRPVHSK